MTTLISTFADHRDAKHGVYFTCYACNGPEGHMTPAMEMWARRKRITVYTVELDYQPLIERFGDTPVHEVPRNKIRCPNCKARGTGEALHFVANTKATGDYPAR